MHTLDFYFDFSSPFAYLASTQVDGLVARAGARLVERPMLLGAVFKAVGQVDVPLFAWPEVKRKYFLQDIQRWADFWDVPFRFPSRFPMNTVRPLRAYLLLDEGRRAAFRAAAFHAFWAEDRDISDDEVLRELIGEGAADVLSRLSSSEAKEALFEATQKAIETGVFGAPTWVVDGSDLYWGQDRINLVERALGVAPSF